MADIKANVGSFKDAGAKAASITFTLFPKLPAELQIKIWKHAIPAPRLVRVKAEGGIGTIPIRLSTNTPAPDGLLRACKTSRETIQKVYTTCLESGERKIRMDGDNDVLVLFSTGSPGDRALIGHYEPLPWLAERTILPSQVNMFSGVKSLATPNYAMNGYSNNKERWFLSQFQSLELYFPLERCMSNNLNTQEDELYLTIPREQLIRLELETSAGCRAIQWGIDYSEENYMDEVEGLQRPFPEVDVVLALVSSVREME